MHTITRTIYGSRLQTLLLLGAPFTHIENTTLNERFDVQAGVLPPNGEVPAVRYFCIGNGGHRHLIGPDGFPLTDDVQHSPADAALYRHLPFLLRELDNDLTILERQKYAMRKIITVGGTDYIAYYLKRIDFSGSAVTLQYNDVTDDAVSTTPFIPTGANLNPTPPPIPPVGVITTTGDYLSTSAILGLDFSAADVAELINVANLLYNNELYAVISEIGLVAGVDRTVTASGPGGSINYVEALMATITTHITAYNSVSYNNNGFDYDLELGAVEPLVGVAAGI